MSMYAPLSRQNKEIRLLLLHAGQGEDQIQCSLRVVSLHDGPKFEALSYVWGEKDPTDNTRINLDGQSFSITPNLHAALKRLRQTSSQRTLWVDAVCINQGDNAEKSVQVAMMSDIYARTSGAILWLGEEPELPVPTVSLAQRQELDAVLAQTEQLFANFTSALQTWQGTELDSLVTDLMAGMAAPQPTLGPENFLIGRTCPHTWHGDDRDVIALLDATTNLDLAEDSIFHAFALFRLLAEDKHLYDIPYFRLESDDGETCITHARRAAHWLTTRPWWFRIWTAQECILPPTCTLRYGPVSMPWDVLLNGLFNFQRHRDVCCAAVPGVLDMLNLQAETVIDLHRLRANIHGCSSDAAGPATLVSLTDLLSMFRHRGATNLRDKIYALLPIVTQWYGAGPLVPDYTKSVAQVYTDAVLKTVKDSRSLDILCRPPEGEEEKRLPDLPSWVIDLSQPAAARATLDRLVGMLPLYDACGGLKLNLQRLGVHEDAASKSRVVALEGMQVDALKISPSTTMRGMDQAMHEDTLKWWYDAAAEQAELGNIHADSDWKEMFAQTVCGGAMVVLGGSGMTPRFRKTTREDRQRVQSWVETLRNASYVDDLEGRDEEVSALNRSVKAATLMRGFVVSRKGRMALVPNTAVLTFPRPDQIFVFPGARSPVVLRDVGVREIAGVGPRVCHVFLGDCYLDGAMDGRWMQEFEERKQMVYLV